VQQVSPAGTFNRTTNVAVLIEFAYDVQGYQVVVPCGQTLCTRAEEKPDGDECKRLVEQPRNVPPGAVRAAGCTTMASFAAVAPRQMGAPFIDSTGLVGLYETSYYYDAAGGFLGRGITPDMSSGEVAAAAGWSAGCDGATIRAGRIAA
jgi:hypothetical protein